MAKPIIVITVPSYFSMDQTQTIRDSIERKIDDYHTLLVTAETEDIKIQVFHEKDYVHIESEGLNKVIADYLKEHE